MSRGEIVYNSDIETYTICGKDLLKDVIKEEKRKIDLALQMGISNIHFGRFNEALQRIANIVKPYTRFDLKSLVYHYMVHSYDPHMKLDDRGFAMYTLPASINETVIIHEGSRKKFGEVNVNFNVTNRYLLKVQYLHTSLKSSEVLILAVKWLDGHTYTVNLNIPEAYLVEVPRTEKSYTLRNANVPRTFTSWESAGRKEIQINVSEFLTKSASLVKTYYGSQQRDSQYFIIEHGAIKRDVLVLKTFDTLNDMVSSINADVTALVTSIWSQIRKLSNSHDLTLGIKLSTTLVDTFPCNGLSSFMGRLNSYVLLDDRGLSNKFSEEKGDLQAVCGYMYSRIALLYDMHDTKYVDISDKTRLFSEEERFGDKHSIEIEVKRTLITIFKMDELLSYLRNIINKIGKTIKEEDMKFVASMPEVTYAYVDMYYEAQAEKMLNIYLEKYEQYKRTDKDEATVSICISLARILIENFTDIVDIINR